MRGKPVLLALAMICGAITATGASKLTQEAEASSPKRTVEILVAARQLCPGASITAERLALVPWPSETVPSGAISTLQSLEGLVPTGRIEAGEAVVLERLIDADSFEPQPTLALAPNVEPESTPALAAVAEPIEPNEKITASEPIAASEPAQPPVETTPVEASMAPAPVVVPHGYSVVSLVADESVGLAYPLQPGDRVNVAAYFPATESSSQACVRELFRGIEVFAVKGAFDRTAVQPIATVASVAVSLLIPSGDETAWTLATELGQIRLSLTGTTASAATAELGLARDFVRWIEDRQTARAESLVSLPQAVPAENRSQGFRMMKIHGEDWTEYEVPSPDRPPVVIGSSRPANRLSVEPASSRGIPERRSSPTAVHHRAADSSKLPPFHWAE